MKLKIFALFPLLAWAATIPVAHNDAGQTGANTAEQLLTPANVANLRKLGTYSITGFTFAQPLYAPNVVVSGIVRNLLIASTLSSNVYAFDADSPGSAALWTRTLGFPRVSYPNQSGGNTFAYGKPLGIVSTPVVDVGNSKLYVVAQNTTPAYTLYQLDLSTGATLQSVVISGHVTGTGDPIGGDDLTPPFLNFNAGFEFVQRPGLVMANSKVYASFGSTDLDPYHGWIFAYNTSDLSQAAIFCDTPNGAGGSIWMSGGAPSVDGSGNLYVTTGNGDYDGITSFGETVLKLSPSLAVLDHFTPANWASLNGSDSDVSSNRFILIPGTALGVMAAKDFNVYLIDTTCMGGLQGSGSGCSLQAFKSNGSGVAGDGSGSYGGMFSNNTLYLPTTTTETGSSVGSVYSFSFSGSTFTTTPLATRINTYSFPGAAQMSGSSNGGSNGLVWIVTAASSAFAAPQAGTLRALDATTLSELWTSGATLGTLAKYSSPTVASGRVYVATEDNTIAVFGLNPSALQGSAGLQGSATLLGGATIH